jgi:rhodanese-related sulfurtransferase
MTDKTYEQMVAEAKTRIREVTPEEAIALRRRGEDAVFLDVREPQEWNLFRIPGAVHIPLGQLDQRVADEVPRDRRVVVYCARGNRSALAADTMQNMGYTDVASMAAGITGWAHAGGDIDDA